VISNLTPGALAIYHTLDGDRLPCEVVSRTQWRVGISVGAGRVRYVKLDAVDFPRTYDEALSIARLLQSRRFPRTSDQA
jgi:hypothetical protein